MIVWPEPVEHIWYFFISRRSLLRPWCVHQAFIHSARPATLFFLCYFLSCFCVASSRYSSLLADCEKFEIPSSFATHRCDANDRMRIFFSGNSRMLFCRQQAVWGKISEGFFEQQMAARFRSAYRNFIRAYNSRTREELGQRAMLLRISHKR